MIVYYNANSIWTGFHQFIKIKEGLRLTKENANSCYMSNLSFFKKCIQNKSSNLYGITCIMDCPQILIYNINQIIILVFKES